MKRIHAFELEDLPWFPSVIRNCMTDYLQFVTNKFDLFAPAIDILKKGLSHCSEPAIIDLASGGGGAWKSLSPRLKKDIPGVKIKLTDFYPNIKAFETMQKFDPECFSFSDKSINAMQVPESEKGLRTQFLSLHHFKPEAAQQILQNAVDSKAPIALFEAQERNLAHVIQFSLSWIAVILLTPMVRPFSLSRILFTYLIPIVPFATAWDGVISVLRTYSVEEMKEMISRLENNASYEWEVDKIVSKKGTVQYLLGYPKEK